MFREYGFRKFPIAKFHMKAISHFVRKSYFTVLKSRPLQKRKAAGKNNRLTTIIPTGRL